MKQIQLPMLTVVVTTFLFCSCASQKNVPIDIDGSKFATDFATAQSNNTNVDANSIIKLNITNLNKDLYTVKITSNKVSLNTSIPASLAITSGALPSPIFPNSGMGAGLIASCSADVNKEQKNINKNVGLLKDDIDEINKAVTFNNYLLLMEKDCGHTAAQIKALVDNQMNSLTGKATIAAFQTYIQGKIASAKVEYQNIAESVIKIDRIYGMAGCKTPLANSVGLTDSEKAQVADFKTFYAKLLDFEQTGQLFIIAQNYAAVTEPLNYTFSAVDTAKKADEVHFIINITPKNWMPCPSINGTYDLKMKVDRFKVDFSTGLFFNWGNEKFTGQKYFIDTNKKVAQIGKGSKSLVPSVGALVHFYYNNNKHVIPGLVLGTSIASDAKYTNFHGGVSFMFNTDNEIFNRIALSGGLTYRYVNVLNPDYPIGTAVDKNLTIDQLQNGRFVRGGFISLSYNLTK